MLTGLSVGVARAGESLSLGQIGSDTPCTAPADFVGVQTSTSGGDVSYAVPPGRWRIRSWKAAGSPVGKEALVVFRPTGAPDEYTVVGSTRARSLPDPVNKLIDIDLKVKGGDLIGFWVEAGTTCALATGDSNDAVSILFPAEVPTAGTTMALVPGLAVGYRMNMKVNLTRKP